MKARILVFAKAPVPGKVKTRLIPALGAQGAAALAQRMLERTLKAAAAAAIGPIELCVDPPPEDPCWDPYRHRVDRLSAQGDGDLGERLGRAARRTIAANEAVLLIGTDCPDLDHRQLRAASERLDDHQAVIQPATDGGYVLLGLNHFHPILFTDMAWSTSTVAAATIARIGRLGWSLHIAETLHDVDEPADLERTTDSQ